MGLKSLLTAWLVAILFGCGEASKINGKFESGGGGGCSSSASEEETPNIYLPTDNTPEYDMPDLPNPGYINPEPYIPTYYPPLSVEDSLFSDWRNVNQMPGVSYRIKCAYDWMIKPSKYFSYDVIFSILVKNSNIDKYIFSSAIFGIPKYTDDISTLFDYRWGIEPERTDYVFETGYESSKTPYQQCKENFTGIIGFGYTDVNGLVDKSSEIIVSFDSDTLNLK